MVVNDGLVHLDFTGSDPQVDAAYNIPTGGKRHPWLTLKLMHFIFSNDRSIPLNHGVFNNITVEAPFGTIVNPEPPAAVGIRSATAIRLNEALVGAMTQAQMGLMPAPSGGIMIPSVLVEQDSKTGARQVMVLQSLVGGTGARQGADGVDGRDSSLANQRNTPIEKTEEEAAAKITEYALRKDSGGPGEWRGGTGVVFSVRIAKDGSSVLGRGMERFVFRPWGIAGGKPGERARVVVNLGLPNEKELGKLDIYNAEPGDIVTIMTPGGGGFGDPLKRPEEKVLEDVLFGYVSEKSALEDYGVVIQDGNIQKSRTREMREKKRCLKSENQTYNFGPERDAWEQVFDDNNMCELNSLLMQLGTSVRSKRRADIFYAVMPSLAEFSSSDLGSLIGDPKKAKSEFERQLDVLRSDIRELSG
tara:strand:- start:7071 stop:8321 length:1251 start_codon:yes stop_codon:yes gene_type:complete